MADEADFEWDLMVRWRGDPDPRVVASGSEEAMRGLLREMTLCGTDRMVSYGDGCVRPFDAVAFWLRQSRMVGQMIEVKR